MSAPKAQTSRFERDKKRERERDDDDVVWVTLLCFCTHEKTRDPKRSPKREDEEKRSFFSPIYYVCVRIKEWGKSALDLCSPTRERQI